MNDTRDDSENFSIERQYRTGRDSNLDERREDTATTSAQTDKSPSAATLDDAFPDRIRRKYYVVANKPERDESNGVARLYADERGEYLAFKVTEDRLITRLAAAEVIATWSAWRNIDSGRRCTYAAPWSSGARLGLRPVLVASKSGAISRPISIDRRSPIEGNSGTEHTPAHTRWVLVQLLTKTCSPNDSTTTKVSQGG